MLVWLFGFCISFFKKGLKRYINYKNGCRSICCVASNHASTVIHLAGCKGKGKKERKNFPKGFQHGPAPQRDRCQRSTSSMLHEPLSHDACCFVAANSFVSPCKPEPSLTHGRPSTNALVSARAR